MVSTYSDHSMTLFLHLLLVTQSLTNGVIHVAETRVETVHIVLPVHANHHSTTFGGQVRACMCTFVRHVVCQYSVCHGADHGMDD